MYDYIIVGAGSAGCVLANRLSKDPANKVCLIEAGGSDKNPIVYTPLGVIASLAGGLFNWSFNTPKQKTMNGREIYCPRGKVLGGSSSINAMLYVRGQKEDYDRWAADGNQGWSYDEVLPYFKKSQHQERGGDDFHGVGGPLNVAEIRNHHPIGKAFIDASSELGEQVTNDFNGADQEGVGWFQTTQKNGQRCSAAAAYLHPVLKQRSNLTVITNAQTARVILEDKRAVGIEIIENGKHRELRANNEVILSAGAFGSPQIMLLSGIGPADKLHPHGIEQQHKLAGVGENLQEHVDVLVVAKDKTCTSWAPFRPLSFIRSVGEFFRYLFKREGMFSSTIAEAGGFIKVDEKSETPDVQLHASPLAMDDHGRRYSYYMKYGLSAHVCVLRPKSRGHLALNSASPTDEPLIDLNMLSDKEDVSLLIKGVKRLREILRAPALSAYTGEEISPGVAEQTDEELEAFVRNKANHVYHPVGTCKMGSDDMAVVDSQLRVRGLTGLRVVDASIMPTLISGNTNAPTIMIGEKAADMILNQAVIEEGGSQSASAKSDSADAINAA